MEFPLYNQKGESVGRVQMSDRVFSVPLNNDLLHQVVTSQSSNQRQSLAHAKARSEVRGGGRKPWRQKGTGQARHGSIRSPLWKGGGVTFGPTKERNFKKKINVKAARKALGIALSSKTHDGQLAVVDEISLSTPKTKEMALIIKGLSKLFSKEGKIKEMPNILLIVPSGKERTALIRSSNNLSNIKIMEARNMNALSALTHQNVILFKDAIPVIEQTVIK